MNLRKIYTSLLTADLAAAEAWYTKLLGRRPDYRPMDTLVQWELCDHGGLMLSDSEEIDLMEFSPGNAIVKQCLIGLGMEEKGLLDEARECFHRAWSGAGLAAALAKGGWKRAGIYR